MRALRLLIALVGCLALIGAWAPARGDARHPEPTRASAAATEGKVSDPVPLLEFRTAGDVGWFWTSSNSEAAAAGEQQMKRQSTKLGYLRRQAFDGSQPLFRLRLKERSAYLVTGSADERKSLLASGDWEDEGTLGHVWAADGPDRAPLWRMSNGAEWRIVPDAQRDDFTERGYQTDGRLGFVQPTFRKAGAIYFGTWDGDGNQALLDNVEKVYQRRDPWGGIRDFAGGGVKQNAWHWADEDWSDLEPSIGYYDDSDPATLEKQIDQAAGAGLDHFAFYWYWNPAEGGAEQYVAGLRSFLKAKNREKLDFTIMPCIHPWSDGPVSLKMPTEQIDKAAQVIVDEYLTQPNFLRANDGRKLLTVCDSRGLGAGSPEENDLGAVRQFNDTVRAKAREQLGEEIMITNNADIGIDAEAAGFEGQQCQGQWDPSRSYQRYVDHQRDYFAARPGPLVRCVTSNFDERPRISILIKDPDPPTQENLEASFRWYDDHSFERFESLLDHVETDIQESDRPELVDNFVLVYAWNEWHEGGYIEPNRRDGCAYLDAIRSAFKLTGGSGCKVESKR